MALPEGVETFAGRLATFDGPQQVAKRRASSTKKKTANTVSWPHNSPSPEELAKAGFFYKPSATTEDSVTCFICHKSLDGWDANDNPAFEHLAHVPDCGWAINVCIEQRMQDDDRAEEDPMNEKMMDARRATFRDAWPHEQKKGWKCKTKKMVEAGWCYNPVPEAEDCVQCFYCGVSLDGWEPKDDPRAEHQRRAPECHFFTLVEESTKLQKTSKAKKGRTSRTSKNSRLSTQSNKTITSEAPSFTSIENTLADEGDTIMSTATNTSKGGRKQPARKKAGSKSTRPGAKTKKVIEEDSELVGVQTETDVDNELEGDTTIASAAGKKPKTKRAIKRAPSEAQVHDTVVPDENATGDDKAQKKTRTRPTKKAQQVSEEENDLQSHMQANLDQSEHEEGVKPKRGIKRSSNGVEKVQDTTVPLEQLQSKKPASKPPRAKVAKQKKNKTSTQLTSQQPSNGALSLLAEGEGLTGQESSQTPDDELLDPHKLAVQHDESASILHSRTTTPQKTSKVKGKEQSMRGNKNNAPSPSTSPQSSDAENQPPSSRPSFNAGKDLVEDHQRPAQIVTPSKSPAKRNIIAGGLQSSFPWDAIDLEMALVQSPNSRPEGKENLGVDEVLQQMTSPEKKMNVEQWIKFNAEGAEDRLRRDCERLVGVFESEGMKALRAVEGIECL